MTRKSKETKQRKTNIMSSSQDTQPTYTLIKARKKKTPHFKLVSNMKQER